MAVEKRAGQKSPERHSAIRGYLAAERVGECAERHRRCAPAWVANPGRSMQWHSARRTLPPHAPYREAKTLSRAAPLRVVQGGAMYVTETRRPPRALKTICHLAPYKMGSTLIHFTHVSDCTPGRGLVLGFRYAVSIRRDAQPTEWDGGQQPLFAVTRVTRDTG